jgi:photosystem II stability/assembly factor-like uncharacterized protein
MSSRVQLLGRVGAAVLMFAGVPGASAQDAAGSSSVWKDPATAPAEILDISQVQNSLLLDATNSRDRAVVVGDRGHILVSESRREWRQVPVPTRSMLTAITAVDNRMWAVGHDQVIVYSSDGGLTWTLQNVDIAAEGPLLDVLFLDSEKGFAIGAYGQFLSTSDGGAKWKVGQIGALVSRRDDVPAAAAASDGDPVAGEEDDESWLVSTDVGEDETDPHLNAIVRTDRGLLILAEAGKAYRSIDEAVSWEQVSLPYDGSMFGAIALTNGNVMAFGLRGNVFETSDLGLNWVPVDAGSEATLLGGAALDNDGAILVGASGTIVRFSRGSRDPRIQVFDEAGVMSGILPVGMADFLVVGENGARIFTP